MGSMPDNIEEIVDISASPKEITNPKKIMKVGLGLVEVAIGGIAETSLNAMLSDKLPVSPAIVDGMTVVGSALASGAINNPHASNVIGGMSIASGTRLAKRLIDFVKSKLGMSVNQIIPAANPTSVSPNETEKGGYPF